MKYKLKKMDLFKLTHSLYVIVTNPMTHEQLKDNWSSIRNEIMMNVQEEITDDFSRWNFYVFYVVKNLKELDDELRYKIEHDTISSRKILIDENEVNNMDDVFKGIVEKYINYNIDFHSRYTKNIMPFEKSKEVVELIGKINHEDKEGEY